MKTSLRLTVSLIATALASAHWMTGPARSEAQAVHVVEMFTSQGCSSCLPADKLLKTLAGRSDVIALSFHVDYWDRLGWKDTFGSPASTKRQRGYAINRGDGQVYTPQAVINGRAHEVGHNRSGIERAMAVSAANLAGQRVPIAITVTNGKLVVTVGDAASPKVNGGVITLLGVQAEGAVTATRGENSGARLAYTNIVRASTSLGSWNGTRLETSVAKTDPVLTDADAAVVLIQRTADGPIIGAAKLALR